MDECTVVLTGEVLIELSLWNPCVVVMIGSLSHLGWHCRETTVMVSTEEVCPHALHTVVYWIFFLFLCEASNCVMNWWIKLVLYFEQVVSVVIEKSLFSAHEGGAKLHSSGWELPFLSVLIPEDQKYAIFRSVVQTAHVLGLWINFRPIFAGCTVSFVA